MKSVIVQLSDNYEFGNKFDVDDLFWADVNEIVTVLQPGFDFTVNMQKVGYGLADLYIGWLRVKKSLQKLSEKTRLNLATKLIENIEHRASSLFNSPLLLCAVYLDPRMSFTLTDEQKSKAAADLISIHDRISKNNESLNTGTNDTLDEMMQEFNARHTVTESNTLIKEMSVYETEKSSDYKAPVMTFWEDNAQKYQLLRPLADLLHAIPSNQCCTERSFSSFTYVRNKLRMAMFPQNISNVLMVRLNKDIYYHLREQRIKTILA